MASELAIRISASDAARPALKSVSDSLGDIASAATAPTRAVGSFIDALGRIGLAGMGLATIAQSIAGVATSMVSGNAEMETYETQLTTLLGSADLAKERLAELAKFGAETPFELPEVVRAEKVLVGFGLTGKKAFEVTGKSAGDFRTIVGDIAAGTGSSFEEIALNMGKFSAGATGEAISRFQELGIATREQMAAMGVQFSKSGELLSPIPQAMQAVVQIAQSKFGGGMDKLSKTFAGQMSTLSDNLNQAKIAIMQPIFEVLKDSAGRLNDVLGSAGFQTILTTVAATLAGVVKAGLDLAGRGFVFLQSVAERLTAAFNAFRPTAERVLGIVGSLLGDIISEGGDLGVFADSLRELGLLDISGLVKFQRWLADIIGGQIGAAVTLFQGLGSAAKLALTGDFAGAFTTAKAALVTWGGTLVGDLQRIGGDIASKALEWGKALWQWVSPQIPGVLAQLAAFALSVVNWMLAQVPTIVATLLGWGQAFVDWVGPKIPGVLAALGTLAANIGTWIVAQVPTIVATLLSWGSAFVDWIGPKIPPLLAALAGLALEAVNWVVAQTPTFIQKLLTWGAAFIDWVAPKIAGLLAELGALSRRVIDWIVAKAPDVIDALLKWGAAFVDWVGPKIQPMLMQAGELAKQFLSWIGDQAGPILAKLGDWAAQFVAWIVPATEKFVAEWPANLNKFLDWIEGAAVNIASSLGTWIKAFIDWVGSEGGQGATGGMLNATVRIATAILTFIATTSIVIAERLVIWAGKFLNWIAESVLPQLPGALSWIANKIYDFIAAVGPVILEKAKEWGISLIRGMVNGILSLPQAIGQAIAGVTPTQTGGNGSGGQWQPPPSGGQTTVTTNTLPPGLSLTNPQGFNAQHYGLDPSRYAWDGGGWRLWRDRGGPGAAGQPYLIGQGAQPELFVPNSAGQFYPRGQYSLGGGATTVRVFIGNRELRDLMVETNEHNSRRGRT